MKKKAYKRQRGRKKDSVLQERMRRKRNKIGRYMREKSINPSMFAMGQMNYMIPLALTMMMATKRGRG